MKKSHVVVAVATPLVVMAGTAFAALPADVDTAITAAQTDLLAMIGKGFGYLGVVGGGLVGLGMFYRILRRPAR